MESDGVHDTASAEAQLATLQAQRSALAVRVVQPWWYDALLGLLFAGFISTYSTRSIWWILLAFLGLMAGLRGLMALYRRKKGFWVSGLRAGPTQRVTRVWMALYFLLLGAGAAAEFLLDIRGAMVVTGFALGITIAVLSRWWTRIYVAELRGEL